MQEGIKMYHLLHLQTVYENWQSNYHNWPFINFGGHLYIGSNKNLYLCNNGFYDKIFDLGLHRNVCLPIEELKSLVQLRIIVYKHV